MSLLKKIFKNARKPEGILGKLSVKIMNVVHGAISAWGMKHLTLSGDELLLDIGCGGGENVAEFLKRLPHGRVVGLDYSEMSVMAARDLNRAEITAGRCEIMEGDARKLPFAPESFDIVTAFETIYFWPEIDSCFAEVRRVLKKGGVFMINNEFDGVNERGKRWLEIVEGMTGYTAAELEDLLRAAGFSSVAVDHDAGGYLNVLAYKK